MKFSVILLGLLATLGACAASDSGDSYGTVTQFCVAWGKAACSSKVVLTCSGADKTDDMLVEGCVDKQAAFCEGLLPATGYNSAQASTCLSAVHDAYSDGKLSAAEVLTVRHRGAPCNHLIKGAQGVGEDCTSDDDCNTLKNYLCVFKSGGGTCQIPALVENGTSCAAPEAACNPGFYCSTDENCVQSKAAGKGCTAAYECATGLDCDADTSKCVARVSADKCTKDDDCTTNVCDLPLGKCVSSIILAPSEAICQDLQ